MRQKDHCELKSKPETSMDFIHVFSRCAYCCFFHSAVFFLRFLSARWTHCLSLTSLPRLSEAKVLESRALDCSVLHKNILTTDFPFSSLCMLRSGFINLQVPDIISGVTVLSYCSDPPPPHPTFHLPGQEA